MSATKKKSSGLKARVLEALGHEDREDDLADDGADDVTAARVADKDDDDDDVSSSTRSGLRARNALSSASLGARYRGRATTRKDLEEGRGDVALTADEREHEQAELGNMFEVDDDDEDNDDEDDDDEDDDGDEDEREDIEEEEEESEAAPRILSTAASDLAEVEKGEAVRDQLKLWEKLLEMRIQLQKVCQGARRLPRPGASFEAFSERGGKEHERAGKKAQAALKALLDGLLEFRAGLVRSSLKRSATDDDDEEEGEVPKKKKLKVSEYSKILSEAREDTIPFRDSTIQKWNDKTRLASGSAGGNSKSGGFSGFEQTSTLKQIEFVLSDRARLIARTRTKRSQYRVLGSRVSTQEEEDGAAEEEDEEVFDDDDFYHQLLKELIDRKTSSGEDGGADLGGHWQRVQRLRSKARKEVDTRASKGRKTRYDIHAKLVNFMAPVTHAPAASSGGAVWRDDAKNELFSSLFDART